jgi:prephenate dehydrogenase
MRVLLTWSRRTLAVAIMLSLAGTSARVQAQENQHVVSPNELHKDTARLAESRQANETAIRDIFSSEAAQKVLKAAKIDYQRIDKAIGQLSDEDLARLAERSRQVKQDFAAGSGSWSDRDLLIIVIIGVLIIALVAALR